MTVSNPIGIDSLFFFSFFSIPSNRFRGSRPVSFEPIGRQEELDPNGHPFLAALTKRRDDLCINIMDLVEQ